MERLAQKNIQYSHVNTDETITDDSRQGVPRPSHQLFVFYSKALWITIMADLCERKKELIAAKSLLKEEEEKLTSLARSNQLKAESEAREEILKDAIEKEAAEAESRECLGVAQGESEINLLAKAESLLYDSKSHQTCTYLDSQLLESACEK